MKDRIVEYPHRYQMVPAGEDFYDLLPAPGHVTQEGTPINKATLLSDSTAAALGLAGDPTVDNALNAVGNALAGGVRIATGSYVGTGISGAANPNVLTFDFEPYVVFVFQSQYGVAQTYQETAWSFGGTHTVFPFSLLYFFRGGSGLDAAAMASDLNGNLGQTSSVMPYTIEGNSLSWAYQHDGSDAVKSNIQLNLSGTTYYYIAIGKGAGS